MFKHIIRFVFLLPSKRSVTAFKITVLHLTKPLYLGVSALRSSVPLRVFVFHHLLLQYVQDNGDKTVLQNCLVLIKFTLYNINT